MAAVSGTAASDAIAAFAEGMLQLIRLVRSTGSGKASDGFGFVGGTGKAGYSVLHFLRAWLVALERALGSDAFAGVTMDQVAEWTPDERGLLLQYASGTYRQCQDSWGCSPLLASALLCFVQGLSAAEQRALQGLSDDDILRPALRWEAVVERQGPHAWSLDRDFFSPVPASLVHHLQAPRTAGGAAASTAAAAADSEVHEPPRTRRRITSKHVQTVYDVG